MTHSITTNSMMRRFHILFFTKLFFSNYNSTICDKIHLTQPTHLSNKIPLIKFSWLEKMKELLSESFICYKFCIYKHNYLYISFQWPKEVGARFLGNAFSSILKKLQDRNYNSFCKLQNFNSKSNRTVILRSKQYSFGR